MSLQGRDTKAEGGSNPSHTRNGKLMSATKDARNPKSAVGGLDQVTGRVDDAGCAKGRERRVRAVVHRLYQESHGLQALLAQLQAKGCMLRQTVHMPILS